ncbi:MULTISPECIES: FAD-dependent oxidoreductase [unclassified Paraburkholderia]|uniref:FAD-dependent oxidoreductase n=1 Tax=unclassified Paraburkholderia TaxID=2615204 RepID=UPI002AB1F108|nr:MULTISPECIES: FAD-dependent oxidoreductase [unclassified Paraburkholderia]
MSARGNDKGDGQFDLIVVGAGAGGMTAAVTAAHQGLKVVLCEATAQVGGTTATSAGTLWLPGNQHGRRAGYSDTPEDGERYLQAISGPDCEFERRRAFLESSNEAIAFLERRTALAFATCGEHPDYIEAPGAAIHGRALAPIEFDGRMLGDDFARVRAPLDDFLVLGGMMANKSDVQALVRRYRSWKAFAHTARLVARYARDRLHYRRGTRLVLGNALVGRLLYSLRAANVEVRFETRLVGLDKDDTGHVRGATFESQGQRYSLRAKAGVVLATGGIGHHAGLRAGLDPAAFESLTPAAVRGEGIALAREAGAELVRHPSDFLWQPVSRVPTPRGHRLFPHLYLDRAKPGLLAVDGAGRRFVNEGASYHHFVAAMVERAASLPVYLICDAMFIRQYGLGVIPPGTQRLRRYERSGYLITAATPEALARRLGIDAQALASTIARHNGYAQSGHDTEFGKGDTPVSRFNGDAAHHPNPCLGPIATAPYCALAIWPSDAASSSGLRTDADGRVFGAGECVVEGLYACGNDMASIMHGSYPGPGATLGPAIVFGWRVASHAAAALRAREHEIHARRAHEAPPAPPDQIPAR